MGKITIRGRTELVLAACFISVAQGWIAHAAEQSFEMRHVMTFGSKEGIHPPKVTNRKLAVTTLGAAEHPYGLGFPVAVAIDRRDRIWITDSATLSIHVFAPGGGYREIKKAGSAILAQPSGIVSDRQGRVYMVDTLLANVFVFDEEGEFDRALIKKAGLLNAPTAITLSEDGRTVYVADPPRNLLVALNREGEVNETIELTEAARDPVALATIDNQIWVLGGTHHKIEIFSPSGMRRGDHRWDGVPIPTAFAFCPATRRFLVANPRLMVVEAFDEDGRAVGAFGTLGDGVDQQRRIEGLAVDQRGNVYVVDSHHGKVLVFSAGR